MNNKNITKKYTINVKRNIWTNSNMKRINDLVKILAIMLNNFNLEYEKSVFADITFKTENETLIENRETKVELKDNITYAIVGGIAYNILYKHIANVNLHNFVDHTSDIDIVINEPVFIENEEINEIINKNSNEVVNTYFDGVIIDKNGNKKLNCFYENYSRKLFNEIVKVLNSEKIDMSNTTKFDLMEYSELDDCKNAPENVFMHNEIGNAHLIRIYNIITNNLKIQFVLKTHGVIDHLFEIIIKCGTSNWVDLTKQTKQNFYTFIDKKTNINIQDSKGLVLGNFDSYNNRKQMLDVIELKGENYYHKPINHVGRLLYLLFLFKNMKNSRYVKENIDDFCVTFMYQIKYFLDKNKNVDALKYYVIKKTNTEYDIIDIKIIDIIKAFIDVFYNISSDGVITKRIKTMYEKYPFNNKNIKDVFENDVLLKKFDSNKPFINTQYNDINNMINENNIRSKFNNLIKTAKKPKNITNKKKYNSI